MFCEFSKTQLQQLQGVYNNYTPTTGSEETASTEKLYIMPKVKELLSVLKTEYGNEQNSGEFLELYWCLSANVSFILLLFHKQTARDIIVE